MLLPSAEAEIMQMFWQDGSRTVKQVHRTLAAQRALPYPHVMSTIEHLTQKGMLGRERVELAYLYTPTLSEREFVTRAANQLLDCLVRDYPGVIGAYLATQREVAVR
jgi:predicted transcriptional regulator